MISWEVFMDIIALHRRGLSERKISERLGCHRKTVKRYIQAGQKPEYRKTKRRGSILTPYYPIIEDLLEEDDYRATWIYNRVKQIGYPGGYDTVKLYIRKIKKKLRRQAYLRFETVPGLQGQMDWADFQVADFQGGSFTVYLFVLVLGFSRAMFAMFVDRCTLQSFMDAHIHSFHYLGGIPMEMLYDNMKNVVISRTGGQTVFNVEFFHFTQHYGFKPMTCPPYSPWVKGKVERPVDYIRESFWRGYHFTTIEQANRDLLRWLNETANCREHGTHRQRVDMRWQQELKSLSPCPATDYDTSLKEYRRVYKDCFISYNASQYQVPPDVIGKKILLKIKDGVIRFYDDDRLLVTHCEAEQKGTRVSDATITAQILKQRKQGKKKYGRIKGKATRGLVNGSLYPQVLYRPLSFYDQIAQGGGAWIN
ncbi:IstA4: transposase for insertion sequence element IS21 [Desulfosarcina variabilis str. Montpellier]